MDIETTQRSQSEISGAIETVTIEAVSTAKVEGQMAMPDEPESATTRITGVVITEALVGDDFRSSMEIKTDMGFGVFGVTCTMASGDFEPTSPAGKTVIDLFNMSPSESEALDEELSTNGMQAMMGAMSRLPQSVFSLFMSF